MVWRGSPTACGRGAFVLIIIIMIIFIMNTLFSRTVNLSQNTDHWTDDTLGD